MPPSFSGSPSTAGLIFLLLLPGLALAADPAADPAADGAVLADLPMLSVEDSPLIHLDLAAPGDPPLPVVLDTGLGTSIGGAKALQVFGGKRQPGELEAYARNTRLGRPLIVAKASQRDASTNSYPFVRLGGEALRGTVVELDFVAERVRFLDPDKVELPKTVSAPDEAAFELHIFGSRALVQIELNDHLVLVALDTSAAVPLWLAPRELAKAGISSSTLPTLRPRSPTHTGLRLFETDLVRLGSIDPGVFPVIIEKSGHRDAFGVNGPVLGLDLLSQFRVRIDIDRKRLWLKHELPGPVEFGGLPYSLTRQSGAYMTNDGDRFMVYGVLPGSPAELLGLQPGDAIGVEHSGIAKQSQQLNAIRKQAPLFVLRPGETRGEMEEILLPLAPPTPD